MIRLLAPIMLGILIAPPVSAKNGCPPDTLGPKYPWLIEGVMPGDMYAELYLDVDEEGRPIACNVGKNNVVRDIEYRACAAYLRGWQTDRPEPGADAPRTVKQLFLFKKRKHLQAQREARAAFFAQHPELDTNCYPKDY